MSQARFGPPAVASDVNVTPLADVMLVLLIIFMVVTPLLRSGVDVRVPAAEHPTDHPDDGEALVLAMTGDGGLFLNDDELVEARLTETLSAVLEPRAEKALYLRASELLDYGRVLEVMDVCRRAGAEEVALITRKKK